MKKKLVVFDDETAKVLESYPNQSEVIRKATQLYIEHMSTDTLEGLRATYKIIAGQLKEIDLKIDYVADRVR